ncbi:YbaB/EbfC family nucleoid-associated protein [Lentzea nigeriaca]|uniref:YbaB/EbfC family nucleoid-associated protein n=1 Tax=Lentzea nigeriaca TaxID=1128665 RepID=UPI0019592BE8|nr:YbaB/EbfC family nucleoid-associated protein [Lentzea nigeriaca]MBM7864311.1 DNA-binding protein YbaB [Lentzea nigeriaca]
MNPDEDYEAVLAERQALLAQVRAGTYRPADDARDQEVTGTSGDGAVRVVMRNRRVVSVVVGQAVPAKSRREVADLLLEAINPAVRQSLALSPQAGDPGPDLDAVGTGLTEAAEAGGQALRRIQDAVEQSMAKLAGKVQVRGDASPQYVDFLFDEAMEVVRSMRAALGSEVPVTGEGRDEANEVVVTVCQGELNQVTLSSSALQMSPGEFGLAVQQAVNDALTDWERHSAEANRQPRDTEALQQLAERAGAVRRQSMEHLRTYTDSMTAIMRNVDK